jgi:hypothetical protein
MRQRLRDIGGLPCELGPAVCLALLVDEASVAGRNGSIGSVTDTQLTTTSAPRAGEPNHPRAHERRSKATPPAASAGNNAGAA